jgi:uncharacterized protein YndB with AHSA1/START domain
MIGPTGKADWAGEVLEFQPSKRLSYTWASKPPSRVTFQLEPYGTVVRLTVTHEGIDPGSKEFEMTRQGRFVIMSSLKSLLETGKALTYPRKG